jgi:hypothetical protein
MKNLKHISLMLAMVIGAFLTLPSCGDDDDGADAIVLDGLWEITDIKNIPIDEPVEEDATPNETAPLKAAISNFAATTEPDINQGAYLKFGSNNFEYYMVSGGQKSTLWDGTYLLSDKTLTLTPEESSIPAIVAKIEYNGTTLSMEMTIDDIPQIWYAQKIQDDTTIDDDNGKVSYIDFEKEVHLSDKPKGSVLNPVVIVLKETISGTLEYIEDYKAEQFYYLKVDSTKTYELTVQVTKADYSQLPTNFMKYLQVWLSYQPYEKNFIAEDKRIEMGEDNPVAFENIDSPTGYLYIRLFSYQDKIEYKLTLKEQD